MRGAITRVVSCQASAPSTRAASMTSRGQALEAGQQDDEAEADVLPHRHGDHRAERRGGVAEPGVREGLETDPAQERVEEPGVRLVDPLEDDRDHDQGHHDGDEEERPEQRAAAHLAVQEQGEEEAETDLEGRAHDDEDDGVPGRLPEDLVAGQGQVVRERRRRAPTGGDSRSTRGSSARGNSRSGRGGRPRARRSPGR